MTTTIDTTYWGQTIANQFNALSDTDKKQVAAALDKLPARDDRSFIEYASSAIYQSASMNRFDYKIGAPNHIIADACYTESCHRLVRDGHSPDCHIDSLYHRAFRMASQGVIYDHGDLGECSCGKDSAPE